MTGPDPSRPRPRLMAAASALLAAAGLAAAVALLALGASWDRPPRPARVAFQSPRDAEPAGPPAASPREAAAVPEPSPPPPAAPPAAPPAPRRLPIAGAPGNAVVIAADGSSYLETEDGARVPLVAPGRDASEVVGRVAARLARAAERPRLGDGQLVVLDYGVVEVPKDAVITFTGPDRLVVLRPDGGSTAYHTDGRVVRRDRPEPRPAPGPAS